MNSTNQQFAMILTGTSYRIINYNLDNYRISNVYYDSIPNPLSTLPNDINFTHLNNIYVNSTQESTNITPLPVTTNNLDNSIVNTSISTNNIYNSINRSESSDDLFNLINTWINSISTNNNNSIHVNYLEEPQSVKVNMSPQLFLEMIKPVNFSSELENKQCPICTLEFEIDDNIRSTPCNHFFHMDCIYQWLTKHCTHPLCPVCRHDCREPYINNQKKKKNKRCIIC